MPSSPVRATVKIAPSAAAAASPQAPATRYWRGDPPRTAARGSLAQERHFIPTALSRMQLGQIGCPQEEQLTRVSRRG